MEGGGTRGRWQGLLCHLLAGPTLTGKGPTSAVVCLQVAPTGCPVPSGQTDWMTLSLLCDTLRWDADPEVGREVKGLGQEWQTRR